MNRKTLKWEKVRKRLEYIQNDIDDILEDVDELIRFMGGSGR